MPKISITRRVNAYGRVGYCSLAFVIAFHLAGCEQGDDDLDTEQESDLDSGQEDGGLGPGQAILNLVRTRTMPDGNVTVKEYTFKVSGATIYPLAIYTPEYSEAAWCFDMPLVGIPTYDISILFMSPGPNPWQLAQGDGQGYAVNVDVPEKEQGGSSPFDGGVMHITGLSGGKASGDVTVGVDVEIMSHVQQAPTGEIIRVESAAFNGIPVQGG